MDESTLNKDAGKGDALGEPQAVPAPFGETEQVIQPAPDAIPPIDHPAEIPTLAATPTTPEDVVATGSSELITPPVLGMATRGAATRRPSSTKSKAKRKAPAVKRKSAAASTGSEAQGSTVAENTIASETSIQQVTTSTEIVPQTPTKGLCARCLQNRLLVGNLPNGSPACNPCSNYYRHEKKTQFAYAGDTELRKSQMQVQEHGAHERYTRTQATQVRVEFKPKSVKRHLPSEFEAHSAAKRRKTNRNDDTSSSLSDAEVIRGSRGRRQPAEEQVENSSILVERPPHSLLNSLDGRVTMVSCASIVAQDPTRYRILTISNNDSDSSVEIVASDGAASPREDPLANERTRERSTVAMEEDKHDFSVEISPIIPQSRFPVRSPEEDSTTLAGTVSNAVAAAELPPTLNTIENDDTAMATIDEIKEQLTDATPADIQAALSAPAITEDRTKDEEALRKAVNDALKQRIIPAEVPRITLEYPADGAAEEYLILERRTWAPMDPCEDIITTIIIILDYFLTREEAIKHFKHIPAGRVTYPGDITNFLAQAYHNGDTTTFVTFVERYNSTMRMLKSQGIITNNILAMPGVHEAIWAKISVQAYERTVCPRVNELRKYTPFSDTVYGELLPRFVNHLIGLTNLKPGKTFVDLGSGVANCIIQASLATGCDSYGIELQKGAAAIAEAQLEEAEKRCRMWGLTSGIAEAQQGDFFENAWIQEKMRKADVVLVNNYAFTTKTNQRLLNLFLELPDGALVVSLKPFVTFRDSGRHSDARRNGIEAILTSGKRHRFGRDCVSWMPGGGDFFGGFLNLSRSLVEGGKWAQSIVANVTFTNRRLEVIQLQAFLLRRRRLEVNLYRNSGKVQFHKSHVPVKKSRMQCECVACV